MHLSLKQIGILVFIWLLAMLIPLAIMGCDGAKPAVIQHNNECKCQKKLSIREAPDKCGDFNCKINGGKKPCECCKCGMTGAGKCKCEFCTCDKNSNCGESTCPGLQK